MCYKQTLQGFQDIWQQGTHVLIQNFHGFSEALVYFKAFFSLEHFSVSENFWGALNVNHNGFASLL